MARRFSPVVVIVYLALFVSVFWRILREFARRRSVANHSVGSSFTSFSSSSHWSSLRKETSSFTTPRRFIPLTVNTGTSETTIKDTYQINSTNFRKNAKFEKTSTNQPSRRLNKQTRETCS
jgi:hypothetical protein